ncbi:Methionine--tRNA ligase, cytoplasmic [Dirofilaria immitis]
MFWFITFSCFVYFFTSVIALRCIIENSIVREFAIENCSSSVFDCFLFRCDKSGIETKERGCNDNLSNLWNCQALGEACMQAGGKAYCDTCVKDLCNSATTFTYPIAIAILSILLTLSITLYV